MSFKVIVNSVFITCLKRSFNIKRFVFLFLAFNLSFSAFSDEDINKLIEDHEKFRESLFYKPLNLSHPIILDEPALIQPIGFLPAPFEQDTKQIEQEAKQIEQDTKQIEQEAKQIEQDTKQIEQEAKQIEQDTKQKQRSVITCTGGRMYYQGTCVCPREDEKWDSSQSQCIKIPKNCTGGSAWNYSKKQCECPSGQDWIGIGADAYCKKTTSAQCPGGQIRKSYNAFTGESVCTCPKDLSWNGSQCVTRPHCDEEAVSYCHCSPGQYKNGNHCYTHNCPGGQIPSLGGVGCSCSVNKIWTGSQCVDKKCPLGHWLLGGKCVRISKIINTCTGGQILNHKKDCVCPSGKVWSSPSRTCINVCPSGQYLDKKSSKCIKIPSCSGGKAWNNASNKCDCPWDQRWDSSQSKCINSDCKDGTWDDHTKTCKCPAHKEWDRSQGLCVFKCKGGSSFVVSTGDCECLNWQKWDATQEKCVKKCPSRQYWDEKSSQCMEILCRDRMYWDEKSSQCIPKPICKAGLTKNCQCPYSKKWDSSQSKCINSNCKGGTLWNEKTKKCECSAVQYWDSSQSKCIKRSTCKPGTTWSDYAKKCVCPREDEKWDSSQSQCIKIPKNCTGGSVWNYSKKQCECPSGQDWIGIGMDAYCKKTTSTTSGQR